MGVSLVIANAITLFHIFVILFVILAPFTGNSALLVLHLSICLGLLTHWASNQNICSLTLMEAHFRGLERSKTFTHQCIAPIYDIGDKDWNQLVIVLTAILGLISAYNLYYHPNFKKFIKCLDRKKSFSENCKCLAILFAP